MPRHARGVITHTLAHVISRGTHELALFPREGDHGIFLEHLQECVNRCWLRVHAYCLMSTHLHLLVEVHETPLAVSMKHLLQWHAQRINHRQGRKGHLFGDRYWARVCARDRYLLALVSYIHLNPVHAGLVRQPEFYRWSSHLAYLESRVGWVHTDLVLSFFARDRTQAIREYAAFIEEAAHTKVPAEPYE